MNWLSIVLLAVMALITYRAYVNGFIRELVSLSGVILAIPIAGVLYSRMFPKVHPIVDNDNLASLLSFLLIFAGVVVGAQVVAHLLKRGVALLNLGEVDRIAGAGFGLLKSVLLCQAVLLALIAFPRPDLQQEIHDSVVARRLVDSAPVVLALLPQAFDEAKNLFPLRFESQDPALPLTDRDRQAGRQ